MKNLIFKIGVLLAGASMLVSCEEKLPENKVYPYETQLISIKILNAGADGNTVVEGIINQDKKEITFPKLDKDSPFDKLRVEATVSEGAEITETVYDYSMEEGIASKTQVIRIQNHQRYTDYFMTIKRRIPVYGADFENPVEYKFLDASKIPGGTGSVSRCADFDGELVLIVKRTPPYVLKYEDLKAGKIEPQELDMTGVEGGTFPVNCGFLANGHIYIASLSGAAASPLKIYYYETPSSKPEVIGNFTNIPGADARHGDMLSANIDKNGDGYIFFGSSGSKDFIRIKVSGHKTTSEPTVLASNANATANTYVYRIEDTDKYLWSGLRLPVTLSDENVTPGGASLPLDDNILPKESVAARMFTFNQERYLMACVAKFGSASKVTPVLNVYNLTKGANAEEAMENFKAAESHNPDYSIIIGGDSGITAPGISTNYHIVKDSNGNDEKLIIFGYRLNTGFVIAEFGIKKEED